MTTYQPTTTDEWIRAQTKAVQDLRRRAGSSDLEYGGTLKPATLAQDYVGAGPAQVKFKGYPLISTDVYDWLSPYIPNGSREVNMVRVGGTWKILGQSAESGRGGWQRIPTSGTWITYNESTSVAEWRDWAQGMRLPTGIVVLSGLLRDGAVTADSVIAVLPPELRPDTDMLFPVNNGDTAKAIGVNANGEIRVSGTGWVASYVSLDGIAYPAAGVAAWTPVDPQGTVGSDHAFKNGWVDSGLARYGVARYWKDPLGLVWFAGLVKSGTTTGNTVVFDLPTTHRADKEQHMVTAGNETFACLGAQPTNGITAKAGASAIWTTLGGITVVTADAAPVFKVPKLFNSWTSYIPATFGTVSIARREDGLCLSRGLLSGGTIGSVTALRLPPELRPNRHVLFAAVSTDARGRIDINGIENPGNFMPTQGVNSWFSLDSIKWAAG